MLNKIFSVKKAEAHCDLPCGIYDPYLAQVAALTVVRMMDVVDDLKLHKEMDYHNLVRTIAIKEEHCEKVKSEIRTIYGDYFKEDDYLKYDLHTLFINILKTASKCKQGAVRDDAVKLLGFVNDFAKIFWQSKGIEIKEVIYPMRPNEKIIVASL